MNSGLASWLATFLSWLLANSSWLATFLCMAISARMANAFLRASPRLYTAMALFACCWAILLPYYSANTVEPNNLFRAISGFLLVYIGGLLMLESQHISGHHKHDTIVPWQVAGLWLLFLVATPPLGKHIDLYSEKQAEFAVGIVLDIAGFLSVTIGTWQLCGKGAGSVIGSILTVYAVGELLVAYLLLPTIDFTSGTLQIPESLHYDFAVGKLIIAVVFGSIIAYSGMEPNVRQRGFSHWILRFAGLTA